MGAGRRAFLKLVTTAGVVAAIQGLRPVPVECADGEVQIEWYVPDDEIEEVGKVAPPGIEHKRAVGSTETRGPAAAVLVGAVAIAALAEAIVKVHVKLRYGGVLILERMPESRSCTIAPWTMARSRSRTATVRPSGRCRELEWMRRSWSRQSSRSGPVRKGHERRGGERDDPTHAAPGPAGHGAWPGTRAPDREPFIARVLRVSSRPLPTMARCLTAGSTSATPHAPSPLPRRASASIASS